MFRQIGIGLVVQTAGRGFASTPRLFAIKKITEQKSFVFPRQKGYSPLRIQRTTILEFPKSEKQLLEERENPSLKIRASGLTKRVLETSALTRLNKRLDRFLEPELNQRRYELWNGMWQTWNTLTICGRIGVSRVHNTMRPMKPPKTLDLSYSQVMQLDRSKREWVKLVVAMSPFFVIPFSLVWWFPCAVVLAKLFPSYIMPAHYMRGKAARIYYARIHRVRKKTYNDITANLNYIRNNRFCPYVVSQILKDVHNGMLPKIDDILKLEEWIKKEDNIHYAQSPVRIQNAYSKMLLNWMQLLAYSPNAVRSRSIDKRLKHILEMDQLLRQNGTLESLTKGQLCEALFIRGVNGFEETLSREAKMFWLENWLRLTVHILPQDLDGQSYEGCPMDANATYTMMAMFLWAVNFNQNRFLAYRQAESTGNLLHGGNNAHDSFFCAHCGYDCSSDFEEHRLKLSMAKTVRRSTGRLIDIDPFDDSCPDRDAVIRKAGLE